MKLEFAIAVAALTLFGLPGTEQAVAAPHSAAPKIAACRFTPPPGLEPGTQSWLGACVRGLAQGPGVLRVSRSSRPLVLYFGSMAQGRPGAGVIERGGDFYPLAGADREVNVRAFRNAAEGARAVARRFEAQGNFASARFYRAEAKRLDNTLD